MSLFLIIAAIDFGTTFSGLAFSFRRQYDSGPQRINVHTWSGGFSPPTSVLFDPKKKFNSFGYEAENKYKDLAKEKVHQKWYLFRRFKMALYDAKTLKRDFLLYDIMGKEMSAMAVFAAALENIKKTLYKKMTSNITEKDIGWVITVPAIWTDAAKQFMREAAEIAGIPGENLMLALEPEAASLFYKDLHVTNIGGEKHKPFEKGSKYMVIDAGGGIVDIVVHEVMDNQDVKEIYKANGGAWGSTRIDDNFLDLLSDLVGRDCFQSFMKIETYDYFEIMREFEGQKRTIKPDVSNTIQIQIPKSLNYTCRHANGGMSINDMIQQRQLQNKLAIIGNTMILSSDSVLQLFKGTINNITNHVQKLLLDSNVKTISTIVMVGGFSEYAVLETQIPRTFPDLKIVFLDTVSVLKGAVMFGYNSETIKERISRFTYGYQETGSQIFSKLVEVGDSVKIDQLPEYKIYNPGVILYASTYRNTTYVTNKSCYKVGKIEIDSSEQSDENQVEVAMMFGKTELQVIAKPIDEDPRVTLNLTEHKIKAYLNCLQ